MEYNCVTFGQWEALLAAIDDKRVLHQSTDIRHIPEPALNNLYDLESYFIPSNRNDRPFQNIYELSDALVETIQDEYPEIAAKLKAEGDLSRQQIEARRQFYESIQQQHKPLLELRENIRVEERKRDSMAKKALGMAQNEKIERFFNLSPGARLSVLKKLRCFDAQKHHSDFAQWHEQNLGEQSKVRDDQTGWWEATKESFQFIYGKEWHWWEVFLTQEDVTGRGGSPLPAHIEVLKKYADIFYDIKNQDCKIDTLNMQLDHPEMVSLANALENNLRLEPFSDQHWFKIVVVTTLALLPDIGAKLLEMAESKHSRNDQNPKHLGAQLTNMREVAQRYLEAINRLINKKSMETAPEKPIQQQFIADVFAYSSMSRSTFFYDGREIEVATTGYSAEAVMKYLMELNV